MKSRSKFRVFWHYNKPASRKLGKVQLTIHFKNKCQIVDKITNFTICETANHLRQPFCTVQSWAKWVTIDKGHAVIY